MTYLRVLLASTAAVLIASTGAHATVTVYTDLASWEAATGTAGTVEDFSSATTGDISSGGAFGPVSFNGFSISGTGNGDHLGVYTNTGTTPDTPVPAPFAGQNYLGWFNGDGQVGPTTTLTFAQPTSAFAFDWFNTDNTDEYQIALSSGDTFVAPPFSEAGGSAATGFFGIVSDTPLTSATISTFTDGGFVSDEGIDNVRTVVPEPATLSILGLGMLGLGAIRRRRRG
jgi:PEP-CTERM motif